MMGGKMNAKFGVVATGEIKDRDDQPALPLEAAQLEALEADRRRSEIDDEQRRREDLERDNAGESE